MNRSSPVSSKSKISLSLSKAIDGFLKFKTAEGLSQRTVTSLEASNRSRNVTGGFFVIWKGDGIWQ